MTTASVSDLENQPSRIGLSATSELTSLLILADDLTGTADSAIGCTTQGLTTQVLLSATSVTCCDAVAIDIDSRACAPQQAAKRHSDCLCQWQGRYRYLYKKIDSTLRGNVAIEIATLVEAVGMAIVAPAYPATGRTTRAGHQWLGEQPVEKTEVWTNEGIQGRANLLEMLSAASLRVAHLDLNGLHEADDIVVARLQQFQREGVQAVVCDAARDIDLERIARLSAELDDIFWVGSAGLGQFLPRALALGTTSAAPIREKPRMPSTRERPTLIVVGSMSGVSHRQADALALDIPSLEVIEIDPAALIDPAAMVDGTGGDHLQAIAARIRGSLGRRQDVMVRLAQPEEREPEQSARLSHNLGELLAPMLASVDRLIATGGATARAVLMAADIRQLTLIDAPDTGMARLAARHRDRPLEVITKAGGFGDTQAFSRIWHASRSDDHPDNA